MSLLLSRGADITIKDVVRTFTTTSSCTTLLLLFKAGQTALSIAKQSCKVLINTASKQRLAEQKYGIPEKIKVEENSKSGKLDAVRKYLEQTNCRDINKAVQEVRAYILITFVTINNTLL